MTVEYRVELGHGPNTELTQFNRLEEPARSHHHSMRSLVP